ncbi:MAG TPA: hypothetical protein VFJ98_06825 [Mycobacteriales bacterium]|nr:hypothetical protein [Mycobacteriales bacterium]
MTTRRAWALPLALAATVVAVIVAVTLIVSTQGDTRGSGRPALLHLAADTDSGTAVATGAAEPALPADRRHPTPGGPAYVLDGTLPDGQPTNRPVWRVATADGDAAEGVAAALHLPGTPTRIDGGWVLRAPAGNRLLVRDDGSWSFGMDCFVGRPLSEEAADVMCAAAAGGGVAAPGTEAAAPDTKPSPVPSDPPDPVDPPQPVPSFTAGPPAAAARADAESILARLGPAAARVTMSQGTTTTTVQASYDVHGTPTAGFVTTLTFDGLGRLVTGDGWLPVTEQGDSYPVISAQRAFELLQQQPRPMLEMCMRRPDGKPGCADIPPTVITGARLGLTMARDGGRPTLVPAWLFTAKGQDDPVVQVAVAPSYLAPAATASDDPMPLPPNGGETRPVVTPAGASPA